MHSSKFTKLAQHVDYELGETIAAFVILPLDEDGNSTAFVMTWNDLREPDRQYSVFYVAEVSDQFLLSRDRRFLDWETARVVMNAQVDRETSRRGALAHATP